MRTGADWTARIEGQEFALTADKAEMIGRVVAACIADGTRWSDCERMCEMVTAACLDDLRYFAATDEGSIGETGDAAGKGQSFSGAMTMSVHRSIRSNSCFVRSPSFRAA